MAPRPWPAPLHRLAALLAALLCAPGAQAQAPGPAPPLQVALPLIRPHSYLDEQGRPEGLYVAVFRELARRSGLRLEYSVQPFARTTHLLNLERTDLTVGLQTTQDALPPQAQIVGTLGHLELVVWPLGGMAPRSQAAQWRGLKVGRLRGGCQALQAMQPDFVELASLEQGLRMGEAGRLQGLCAARDAIQHALQREPGVPPWLRDQTPTLLERAPIQVLARAQLDPAVLRRLQRALEQLREEGRLQALRKQWGLAPDLQ